MSGESPSTEPEFSRENSPEQASERRSSHKGKLERAYARRRLIIDLAKEEKTQRELAALYDCSVSSINEFKARHMPAILEARADLGNEFTGLWIAQKLDRLAELEALFEDTVSARDRETKAMLLRHAAEELGQIPNKSTLDITAEVKVRIEGLDDV
jgi:hypothetical protein